MDNKESADQKPHDEQDAAASSSEKENTDFYRGKKNKEYKPLQNSGVGGLVEIHYEFTPEGKKHLNKKINEAFENIKNNPTPENFVRVFQEASIRSGERSLVNGQWVNGSSPDFLKNLGDAAKAAAGPDGKIAPAQLGAIYNGVITREETPRLVGGTAPGAGGINNLMQTMMMLMEALQQFFGGHSPNVVGSVNGGVNLANVGPNTGPSLSQGIVAPTINAQLQQPPKL